MSAFVQVLRHECVLLWRERMLRLAMAVLLLAGMLAGLRGAQRRQAWEQGGLALQAECASRLAKLRGSVPVRASALARGAGTCAVLPPGPLAGMSAGLSDFSPRGFIVRFGDARQQLKELPHESPAGLLAGPFDPAFVVVHLLPLFAILLCYGMVGRERESGTLDLVRATGAPMRAWLAAKCVARLLWVAAAAAAVTAIAAAAGAAKPGGLPGLSALALWAAASALYGSFWIFLGCWLETRRKLIASTPFRLIGAWILIVVLIPAGLQAAACAIFPAEHLEALLGESRRIELDAAARSEGMADNFCRAHPLICESRSSGASDPLMKFMLVEERIEEAVSPALARHARDRAARQGLIEKLAWLSPSVALEECLALLAGTDWRRFARFRSEVLAFHAGWRKTFFTPVIKRRSLGAAELAEAPVFRFLEEPAVFILGRAAAWLAAILGPALLLAVLSFWPPRGGRRRISLAWPRGRLDAVRHEASIGSPAPRRPGGSP